MFNNAGERLGKIAMVFFVVVTIVSVIAAMVLTSYELNLLAIIVFIAGPGLAYVMALPMIALGEVHMSNEEIMENLQRVSNKANAIEDRVINLEAKSNNGKTPNGTVKEKEFWACTCGKNNPYYVSSCACGVSKRSLDREK